MIHTRSDYSIFVLPLLSTTKSVNAEGTPSTARTASSTAKKDRRLRDDSGINHTYTGSMMTSMGTGSVAVT